MPPDDQTQQPYTGDELTTQLNSILPCEHEVRIETDVSQDGIHWFVAGEVNPKNDYRIEPSLIIAYYPSCYVIPLPYPQPFIRFRFRAIGGARDRLGTICIAAHVF